MDVDILKDNKMIYEEGNEPAVEPEKLRKSRGDKNKPHMCHVVLYLSEDDLHFLENARKKMPLNITRNEFFRRIIKEFRYKVEHKMDPPHSFFVFLTGKYR